VGTSRRRPISGDIGYKEMLNGVARGGDAPQLILPGKSGAR
jgi:hypothetical protein